MATQEEKQQIEALLIALFDKWGQTVEAEGIEPTDLFRDCYGCEENTPAEFLYIGFRAGFDQGLQFAQRAAQ